MRVLLEYIIFQSTFDYKTNRFYVVVRVHCNRSQKMPLHSFCSFHAMTSSLIYYSTHAQQNKRCKFKSNLARDKEFFIVLRTVFSVRIV